MFDEPITEFYLKNFNNFGNGVITTMIVLFLIYTFSNPLFFNNLFNFFDKLYCFFINLIETKKNIDFKNLSLKDINKLIENEKKQISYNEVQLLIFKEREPFGEFFGYEMSNRNGTKDLRLVKPPVLTKKKNKYNFGNSVTIIDIDIKQRKHNILLLERLKKMKFKDANLN